MIAVESEASKNVPNHSQRFNEKRRIGPATFKVISL